MDQGLRKPCGLHCIKMNEIGVTIGDQVILKDINLHIHCGMLTAVIGKNGAGKTTLIRAIIGDVPHAGEIEFTIQDHGVIPARKAALSDDDVTLPGSDTNLREHKRMELKIGYVPQSLNIDKQTPLSVYDMITCYQSAYPVFLKKNKSMEKKVRDSLAVFDAEDLIDRQVCNLSGGQLQRVLLAMAIMDTPDLLLLDEPVSGIDQTGMEVFYQTIAQLKETYDLAILLVSHDLDYVAQYADQVILLDGGEIACQGTARQVYESPEFERIFGSYDVEKMLHSGRTTAEGV